MQHLKMDHQILKRESKLNLWLPMSLPVSKFYYKNFNTFNLHVLFQYLIAYLPRWWKNSSNQKATQMNSVKSMLEKRKANSR